jgi:hypothetical protein
MLELNIGIALLAQYKLMNKKTESLLNHFTNSYTPQMQVKVAQRVTCDFCDQGHAIGECLSKGS